MTRDKRKLSRSKVAPGSSIWEPSKARACIRPLLSAGRPPTPGRSEEFRTWLRSTGPEKLFRLRKSVDVVYFLVVTRACYEPWQLCHEALCSELVEAFESTCREITSSKNSFLVFWSDEKLSNVTPPGACTKKFKKFPIGKKFRKIMRTIFLLFVSH